MADSFAMAKHIDVEKIAGVVDFDSVSKKLDALTESGQLRRRKSVSELLDKIQPALLRAREKKATFGELAKLLAESGIPVSYTALRNYINGLSGARKLQKRSTAKTAVAPKPSASVTETGKKLPPRLAGRSVS